MRRGAGVRMNEQADVVVVGPGPVPDRAVRIVAAPGDLR
ncbi:hypothetical protein STRIP9103_07435 [Streptomyces ipomoeae 91-03]|uniref:Uncharacterized protein n=1 Tax=Streptomyces ipomoeae 91-03 TaxID=698759 RepID=L1KJ91_9ACTN|nr:hypothetical protein STRIP9103_07435 [Streptomyces ipomoeae 91-03]